MWAARYQPTPGRGASTAPHWSSTSISASTGSGGVDLEFASAPDLVEVSTGSGSVEITVPEGTYAVAIDTASGSETIEGVVDDPAAERTITVDTGSGGILVQAGD